MLANEHLSDMVMRLSTRYKRRFHKDVCLVDPTLREIHERLESVDPTALLQQTLEHCRFVVMDTETTGLKAYAGDEVVSIALVELAGLELTGEEYVSYVNPGRHIPAESTRIHGIADADVADSPTLTEVLPEVLDFIGQAIVVGHHVSFDLRFLNKACQKELLTRLYHPYLDTMLLFLSCSGRVGHYTLDEVADECRVAVEDRHSARGDALATALVFRSLVGQLMANGGTVLELAGHQYEFGHFQAP